MTCFSLTLDAGISSGVENGGLKPPTKSETEKVLKNDDYTCRFCGFRSTQFQRVVPFEKHFVTSCSFCEEVLFLARAGMMSTGILVWLPEISQAELNHIARAFYIAMEDKGTDFAKAAERAMDALLTRRTEAKKRIGTEDPLLLSTLFHENLTEDERKTAVAKLDGIRLFPLNKHMVRTHGKDINGFPQIVKFWRSEEGPFANLPTTTWPDLLDKISA